MQTEVVTIQKTDKVDAYNSAVKKGMNMQQVIKVGEGWSVRKIKSVKPSSVLRLKKDAVAKAKEIAKRERTGVVIYSADGEIQRIKSY